MHCREYVPIAACILAAAMVSAGCDPAAKTSDKTDASGRKTASARQAGADGGDAHHAATTSTPAPASAASAAAPLPAYPVAEALAVAGLQFDIPKGWTKQAPASSMRIAQYALPGAADGPAGELIFFYFGPNQGGSAADNVDRWVGQFTDLQSKNIENAQAGPLRLTLVRAEGVYAPAPMRPGAPPQTPQADHALFGLIVEGGPQGSVFVRATGPRAAMRAQAQTLTAFAQSVRNQ